MNHHRNSLTVLRPFESTPTYSAGEGETSRVGKRASNVLKLAQEKDELLAKLREMTERLERAERRRAALESRQNGAVTNPNEPPVSGPPPSSFRSFGDSSDYGERPHTAPSTSTTTARPSASGRI